MTLAGTSIQTNEKQHQKNIVYGTVSTGITKLVQQKK